MRGGAIIEAEGVYNMPLTDRRNFLQRAATFLAASAAGTTTAIVAPNPVLAAPLVQEDPAIIALGGVDSWDSLEAANQIQSCFWGGSLGCDGPVGFERRSSDSNVWLRSI
jgi:hypothetical protein